LPLYWVIRAVVIHNFLRPVPTHGWTIPCLFKVTIITFGSLINFLNIHPLSQENLPTCFPFPDGSSHQSCPFSLCYEPNKISPYPLCTKPNTIHPKLVIVQNQICSMGEDKLSLGCLDMALVIPFLTFWFLFLPFLSPFFLP
jgi:hypothetical protein